MASEDEVVILGRFRDEVSGGLADVEHQIKKTGHATQELAVASEAASKALEHAAEKGTKFRREMSALERQLNDTTAAEIRLLAAEKAADAARKDVVGTSAKDRVKVEKELAAARAELTVKTKLLAKETDNLEIRTKSLGQRMLHAVTGSRALMAGLVGIGSVAVSGALASAAQLVSGIGAAGVAAVGGLAPLVGLLGGLPALVGTLGTAMLTFKMLTGGITKAFGVMMDPAATAQQMDQAMQSLGARGMVLIGPMRTLAQQFRDIKLQMQGAAFPQFARAMTAIAPVVTVVGRGLTGMSKALGDVAVQAATALSSRTWRTDISTMMDRNVTLFRTLAASGGSIANVFRNIAIAAGPMVQMLADAFRGWTSNLDAWFQAKRDSGALEGFFTRTGKLALAVGHALTNFGMGLVNIFRGAAPLGASMGASLTTISEKFRAWTESKAGQDRIHTFFTQMIPVVKEIGGAIKTIVGGFLSLAGSGNAAGLLSGLTTVLSLTLKIVEALAKVNQSVAKIPVIGGTLSGGMNILGALAMLGPGRGLLKGGFKAGKWGAKKWGARGAARAAGLAGEAGGVAAEAGGLAAEAGTAGEVAAAAGSLSPLLDVGVIGGAEALGGVALLSNPVGWGVLAAAAIGTLYVKWKPFHDLVNKTGKQFMEGLRQIGNGVKHANSWAEQHIPGVKKGESRIASNFRKWVSNPLGFFAGGQTPAHDPFMVGELGPELFLSAGSMRVVGADGPEIMASSTPGFVVPNHEMEPVAQALAGATRGGDGSAAPLSVPIDMRGATFVGIEDFERRVTAAAIRGVAEARRQRAERR